MNSRRFGSRRTPRLLASAVMLASLSVVGVPGPSLAADGSLDRKFGDDGIVRVPGPMISAQGTEAVPSSVTPAGRVVTTDGVAGIARFLPSGEPDVAFGSSGKVNLQELFPVKSVLDVSVYSGGKTLVALETDSLDSPDRVVVLRLLADGSIDASFGDAGIFATFSSVYSEPLRVLAVDTNGEIAVATRGRVYRLLPSGQLDATFGGDGATDGGGEAPMFRSGGKLLVGESEKLSQLLPNGRLDPSFGDSGSTVLPIFSGMGDRRVLEVAAAESGPIYAQGSGISCTLGPSGGCSDYGNVAKLSASGQFDPTFRKAALDLNRGFRPTGMAVDQKGRLLQAGSVRAELSTIGRLLPTGRLDRDFGRAGLKRIRPGKCRFRIDDLNLDARGRIVISGMACGRRAALVRLDGESGSGGA